MKRLFYDKGEESAVVDSSICRSKISRIDPSSNAMSELHQKEETTKIGKCQYVIIDGIRAPNKISVALEWLSSGRLNYSRAQPFVGTKDELKKKMMSILGQFKRNADDVENIVDAIMYVYVYSKTFWQAYQIYTVSKAVISMYTKIIKIFINFAQSLSLIASLDESSFESINDYDVEMDSEDNESLEESHSSGIDPHTCAKENVDKQIEASREEVEKYASLAVLLSTVHKNHRALYYVAVKAVVMGKKTIYKAAKENRVSAWTVYECVLMARFILGNRCPRQKNEWCVAKSCWSSYIRGMYATIDGITFPRVFDIIRRWCKMGPLIYSRSRPFFGSYYAMKKKLISILRHLDIRVDFEILSEAVMHAHVYHNSIDETCQKFMISKSSINIGFKIAKIFIDFEKSPCTTRTSPESRLILAETEETNSENVEPSPLLAMHPAEKKRNELNTKKKMSE